MSYIALVNLFNYQEKIFPPPPPHFPTYVEWNWLVSVSIVSACIIGSKHGSRLVLSERTTDPPQVSYISPTQMPQPDARCIICILVEALVCPLRHLPLWTGSMKPLVSTAVSFDTRGLGFTCQSKYQCSPTARGG